MEIAGHSARPDGRTRSRARRRWAEALAAAGAALALVVAPTGAASSAPTGRTGPAAGLAALAGEDDVPVGGVPGVTVPTIAWSDAGDGYQQADVPVPYDYADPGGRSFVLHAVRLPAADQEHKLGSLFVNFGGPGGGAADTVRAAGRELFGPQVLARYDLVGVDPRGTGGSQPVRCTSSTAEQRALPYATLVDFPETPAEQADAVAQVTAFAAGCAALSGDLLDHVGTLQFARDLDVLRAAMGDSRINLYGLSYGTFLGQVLANTFPDRTGALVLDGLVDPAWATGPDGTVSWTREEGDVGSWQTLQRFFELCSEAGPQQCAFAASGDPEASYAALAERLRTEPLLLPVPGQEPQPLGYSELVVLTTSLLYSPATWVPLAAFLQAASAGDAAAAAEVLLQLAPPPPPPGYDNYPDANAAITCADTDNPRDPLAYGRVGQQRDATVAPYFGSRWASIGLPCAPWPGRSTERHTGPWTARTANPVLLIGTRYDPATPYRNAEVVRELLPNSTLLTLDGVGHTSFLTSSCTAALVEQYLLTGATPPAGTVCRQDRGPFDPAPAAAGGADVRHELLRSGALDLG